ncbi:MAG: ribonuclease HII [Candidatus Bathyarchaeota archaeon]|nr:ribonuclease HII [Candidatus Bathyarchaeota archaeon]
MRIMGVDEAGRGCVLGPLVIAGVLMNPGSMSRLLELGVKDSKLLSPRRRESLVKEIQKVAISIHTIELSPAEIDVAVNNRKRLYKLNRLEARAMAEAIQALKPDIAIVDASDVLADRFKHHIMECLQFPIHVISEHRADRNYPVVSAASIIAKVERDHIIERLRTQHGDFGSGYMADPKTVDFLSTLAREGDEYPDFVRRSWKPAKIAMAEARRKRTLLIEE